MSLYTSHTDTDNRDSLDSSVPLVTSGDNLGTVVIPPGSLLSATSKSPEIKLKLTELVTGFWGILY